jgi:ABC-type nitrate/sulfonate/bicarbonate transport system substrate-binding protein
MISMAKGTRLLLLSCLVVTCLLLATANPGPSAGAGAKPVDVSIGIFNVFDETPWQVAIDLGFLKDVNINVPGGLRSFDKDPAVSEAVASGSPDLGGTAEFQTIPQAPTLRNMVWVLVGDIWRGFAFIGRPGKIKTYDEILKEVKDPKLAVKQTVEQFRGKTLIMNVGIGHDPAVNAALALGGLTRKDIKITDLPTVEGATAFLRGEGDLYFGDLPSRFRVQEAGNVPVLTAAQMGPSAVAYVGFVSRKDWLKANEETMLRLLGVWYRVADLLAGPNADQGLDIMRKFINGKTGAKFELKNVQWVNDQISPWFTFEEAWELLYRPGAPLDWHGRLRYAIDYLEKQGTIKKGAVTVEEHSQARQLFMKLMDLKLETETDLDSVQRALLFLGDKAPAEAKSLFEDAKHQYSIRNYVDSAKLARQARDKLGR